MRTQRRHGLLINTACLLAKGHLAYWNALHVLVYINMKFKEIYSPRSVLANAASNGPALTPFVRAGYGGGNDSAASLNTSLATAPATTVSSLSSTLLYPI